MIAFFVAVLYVCVMKILIEKKEFYESSRRNVHMYIKFVFATCHRKLGDGEVKKSNRMEC